MGCKTNEGSKHFIFNNFFYFSVTIMSNYCLPHWTRLTQKLVNFRPCFVLTFAQLLHRGSMHCVTLPTHYVIRQRNSSPTT